VHAIVFGAGKDNERTAAPKNVTFSDNFISTNSNILYEDLNNDGGMIIKNNVAKTPAAMFRKDLQKCRQKIFNGMD
jgi:poly(beta-D-mannuronate) lyase